MEKIPTYLQVKELCKKHNLSEEIESEILEIAKESYIDGSNSSTPLIQFLYKQIKTTENKLC